MSERSRGWRVAAAGLILAGWLSGCGAPPAAPRAEDRGALVDPGPAVAMPTRWDVIPGRTLVVPLDETWKSESGTLTARFDDGTPVEARVFLVTVRVSGGGAEVTERERSWLSPSGAWSAAPIKEAGEDRGTRVLVIRMPEEARGESIRVGGRVFDLNWLPGREELEDLVEPVHREIWRPTVGGEGAVSPMLGALSWPESQSPLTRWRHRMLVDGLRPTREDARDVMGEIVAPRGRPGRANEAIVRRFEDRVIESLARQNEERWRIGLARVWMDDPDLGWRLKKRLTAVVDFGNGVVAPAWPTDHAALDRLLAAMLDKTLSASAVRDRVEGFLLDQPKAVAWVSDDAGTLDAVSGAGVAVVGVANLTEKAVVATAEGGTAVERAMVPVPGMSARWVTAVAGGAVVGVRVGEWRGEVPVLSGRVGMVPPGLTLGPLVADAGMESWMGGVSREPALTTAGVMSRSGEDVELYVECRGSKENGPVEKDVVRVWLGPASAPISVLRIDGTGQVSDEARRVDLVQTPRDVRVIRGVDRWSFRLTLPSRAVEKDGTLRIALTRVDATGKRSAWPRALLPWQDEPGRVAVDTRAWGK